MLVNTGQSKVDVPPFFFAKSDRFITETVIDQESPVNTVSVIYRLGDVIHDTDMDATQFRTEHIRIYVKKAGGPTDFSNSYGSGRWSQAQVSSWISEDSPKPIGRKLARDLEKELGLPFGMFDLPLDTTVGDLVRSAESSIKETPPAYHAIPTKAQSVGEKPYLIPQYDVTGSMGHGNELQEHLDVVQSVQVFLPDLRKQISKPITSPSKLAILTGYGTSMAPTINDGDPLLVDTGVTDVDREGVYVLEKDKQLFIKRMQRRIMDGSLVMSSDNREEHPETELIPREAIGRDFFLRGRVLLAWNARKL